MSLHFLCTFFSLFTLFPIPMLIFSIFQPANMQRQKRAILLLFSDAIARSVCNKSCFLVNPLKRRTEKMWYVKCNVICKLGNVYFQVQQCLSLANQQRDQTWNHYPHITRTRSLLVLLFLVIIITTHAARLPTLAKDPLLFALCFCFSF